jgi:predicted nucleotidyltransferase
MADALSITTQVLAALSRCGVAHVLVGSFARNVHSFARSTKDADIVLAVDTAGLSRFEAELGPAFSLDPQTTFETITGTFRHILIHRETTFKTELFLLSHDAYDQERFSRRLAINFNGQKTYVLTAEDVIVTKLRWLRRKDVEDISDVIAVKGAKLDWDYIHRWTALHATRAKLDEIRATVPIID